MYRYVLKASLFNIKLLKIIQQLHSDDMNAFTLLEYVDHIDITKKPPHG